MLPENVSCSHINNKAGRRAFLQRKIRRSACFISGLLYLGPDSLQSGKAHNDRKVESFLVQRIAGIKHGAAAIGADPTVL